MKKIIICGNYGGSNTGDEAMLEGMLEILRDKADIVVLSHNPKHTIAHHNIKSAYVLPMGVRSFWKHNLTGVKRQTMKLIKSADLFILGGGSLFTDEELAKAPSMWAEQALAAIKTKTPLVMFGQTVGPIKNENSKELVKELFNNAQSIYLRDQASQEFLQKIGIQKKTHLIGDAALILNKKYGEKTESAADDKILFIPRDWHENEKEIEKIKKILESITKVKIISLDKKKESFEESKKESCIMPKKVIQEMKKAEVIVSMRLHGNILAAVASKPFLAISYSPKVKEFCREIGNPYNIELKEVSETKLSSTFIALKKQAELLKNEIQKRITKKVEELETILNELLT